MTTYTEKKTLKRISDLIAMQETITAKIKAIIKDVDIFDLQEFIDLISEGEYLAFSNGLNHEHSVNCIIKGATRDLSFDCKYQYESNSDELFSINFTNHFSHDKEGGNEKIILLNGSEFENAFRIYLEENANEFR